MNVHSCKVTLYAMQFCHMRFGHTTGGCVSLCVCSVWCSEVCTSRAVRYLSLSLWGVEEPHGMREDRSPQSVRGTGEWQLSVPEAAPLPTDGAVQWSRFKVHGSATDIRLSRICTNNRACLPHPFGLACCVLEAAPPAHEGARYRW